MNKKEHILFTSLIVILSISCFMIGHEIQKPPPQRVEYWVYVGDVHAMTVKTEEALTIVLREYPQTTFETHVIFK